MDTWKIADVGKVGGLYWRYRLVVVLSLVDVSIVEGEEMERGH